MKYLFEIPKRILSSLENQKINDSLTMMVLCLIYSPLFSFFGHYSAAFKGSLDKECLVEEEISKDCLDYSDKLEELSSLLKMYQPKLDRIGSLAKEIQAVKVTSFEAAPAADSPEMKEALAAAKKATEEFGADSPEARVAWTELEEIASTGLGNAMGSRLDEECLVDSAMEACQALEELNRIISLEKTRASGLNA